MTEDEMAGWHHHLSGHEFEQTLGDSEGQESLCYSVLQSMGLCYSPWGYKESDTTQLLKTTVLGNYILNEHQLSLDSSLPLSVENGDCVSEHHFKLNLERADL